MVTSVSGPARILLSVVLCCLIVRSTGFASCEGEDCDASRRLTNRSERRLENIAERRFPGVDSKAERRVEGRDQVQWRNTLREVREVRDSRESAQNRYMRDRGREDRFSQVRTRVDESAERVKDITDTNRVDRRRLVDRDLSRRVRKERSNERLERNQEARDLSRRVREERSNERLEQNQEARDLSRRVREERSNERLEANRRSSDRDLSRRVREDRLNERVENNRVEERQEANRRTGERDLNRVNVERAVREERAERRNRVEDRADRRVDNRRETQTERGQRTERSEIREREDRLESRRNVIDRDITPKSMRRELIRDTARLTGDRVEFDREFRELASREEREITDRRAVDQERRFSFESQKLNTSKTNFMWPAVQGLLVAFILVKLLNKNREEEKPKRYLFY